MWGAGAGAAAGRGGMALGAGPSVTPVLARREVCVGPAPPPPGSEVPGDSRRGLGLPRGAGPTRVRGAGPRSGEAGPGEARGGVRVRPPPRQRQRFRLSLGHRRLAPREGGRWGLGVRLCGDRLGHGTSSARPEASPLKGVFSGLPDSRFTPASPQYPNYRSQLLR